MKKHQMLYKILGTFCLIGTLVACAPAATPTVAPPTVAPPTAVPATVAPPTAAPPTAVPTAAPVKLTFLAADVESEQLMVHTLADAYTKLHPNVTFTFESRPGGSDGDNVVKTRLATGTMEDIFSYNAGSLLQALHPTDTLVDISKQPFVASLDPAFIQTVSQNGQVFGVPVGAGMAGGILYNKKIFAQLGLSVPKTWADFEANNQKLKAAGIPPVIQTYGDTWTSQLFVLADYYNVQQALPNFATDYTAGKIKFVNTPIAMEGFNYLQEGYQKGWWQSDYATRKFEPGLKLLADGKGAQYPMLTFALPTIATDSPDEVNDIGFFAQPGTDASKNGATMWMLLAAYIPKTTKNLAVAEDFLSFMVSPDGIAALNAKVPVSGPYLVKGAALPSNVLPAVKDIMTYVNAGNSGPALEFVSPIKGPTLEQLCVAVGTGQMTPAKAAAAYDDDVKKQAQQLGLPGW